MHTIIKYKGELSMTNCVYRIINTKNNKVYIGSTINSERRKLEHFSQLDRGIHTNTYLQNSYNKHGKGVFVFDIIESELKDSELLTKEQHYMNLFNASNENFGYNISTYANRPDGRSYVKVFVVAQREMIQNARLRSTTTTLLYVIQGYISQYTNRISKTDKSGFTNKELEKSTGLSVRVLNLALKELEEKHFIRRVGNRQAREIYFNPYLATRGSEVQQSTYDMFKQNNINKGGDTYQD